MSRKKPKLAPICEGWREQAKKRRREPSLLIGQGDRRGISWQFPPSDVDDGLPRIKSGEFKGRVCFSSKREAQEIAKKMQDINHTVIRYDR